MANSNLLSDILNQQKQELENFLNQIYVKRILELRYLNENLVKVIIGPRRAGKSFFVIHYLKSQMDFAYINFDDERLAEIIQKMSNMDELILALKRIYNNPSIFLFDEIQNIPQWELFINRLQRENLSLIITGSNSNLLSLELASHLTGRYIPFVIFPFSFTEILTLEPIPVTKPQKEDRLLNYLERGGFPEIWLKFYEYKEYLTNLFNGILLKDIIKRYNIRYVQKLEDLAYILISNIATEISFHKLSTSLEINIHTVENYFHYLEETFLIFGIRRFSFKSKEQRQASQKVYTIDNGFFSAKSFQPLKQINKLYENSIAIELKRREIEGLGSVFYYKNNQHEEVDFIWKVGTQIVSLIQVCCDIQGKETKTREIRALLKAGEDLGCENLILINPDLNETREETWFGITKKIQYVPIWQWLSEKEKNTS